MVTFYFFPKIIIIIIFIIIITRDFKLAAKCMLIHQQNNFIANITDDFWAINCEQK